MFLVEGCLEFLGPIDLFIELLPRYNLILEFGRNVYLERIRSANNVGLRFERVDDLRDFPCITEYHVYVASSELFRCGYKILETFDNIGDELCVERQEAASAKKNPRSFIENGQSFVDRRGIDCPCEEPKVREDVEYLQRHWNLAINGMHYLPKPQGATETHQITKREIPEYMLCNLVVKEPEGIGRIPTLVTCNVSVLATSTGCILLDEIYMSGPESRLDGTAGLGMVHPELANVWEVLLRHPNTIARNQGFECGDTERSTEV